MAVRPPGRRLEGTAIAIAVAVIAIFLVLFLFVDFGNETAPTVSEGGESPATSAPFETEPPEQEVDSNRIIEGD